MRLPGWPDFKKLFGSIAANQSETFEVVVPAEVAEAFRAKWESDESQGSSA